MDKKQDMEAEGLVTDRLPNLLYKVDVAGREYICYVSGRMRMAKINVIVGDRVRLLIDKFGGKTTNRIIRRI